MFEVHTVHFKLHTLFVGRSRCRRTGERQATYDDAGVSGSSANLTGVNK
jgi:hypothetical protein